jgi:hypothetical protein
MGKAFGGVALVDSGRFSGGCIALHDTHVIFGWLVICFDCRHGALHVSYTVVLYIQCLNETEWQLLLLAILDSNIACASFCMAMVTACRHEQPVLSYL